MPGYYPRCANCHLCWNCKGSGVEVIVTYEKDWKGNQVRVERKETCKRCRGVGGSVGVGPHDHR